MQVILKGPTEKPCVICGKGDARKVVIRDEDFQGSLCREHVWLKSGGKEAANGSSEQRGKTQAGSPT